MSERLVDSYLKGVEVRRTFRNWSEDVRRLSMDRAYTTISHAIQKDAIQNGWNAKRNKKEGEAIYVEV